MRSINAYIVSCDVTGKEALVTEEQFKEEGKGLPLGWVNGTVTVMEEDGPREVEFTVAGIRHVRKAIDNALAGEGAAEVEAE